MSRVLRDAENYTQTLYGSASAENVIKVLVAIIERLAMQTSPGYLRVLPPPHERPDAR